MPLMRDAETGVLRHVDERYLERWPNDYVSPDFEPNPEPPAGADQPRPRKPRRTSKPAAAKPPAPAAAAPDKSEGENP